MLVGLDRIFGRPAKVGINRLIPINDMARFFAEMAAREFSTSIFRPSPHDQTKNLDFRNNKAIRENY
ncbi:MAG TPA: hypothetical protein DEB39_09735 [Planctomycetaceae bacterium]|nr:hypothetical protein [Planctomycetaceae bacterium]